MSISLEEAAERFHKAGLRITRPREILLRLVLVSDGPFSVKMMHERAEEAGLTIHLATVHRNLAEFHEVGLLDEIPADDNRLYVLHQEQESGAHIYCLDCHRIMALQGVDGEPDNALCQALSRCGFDAATLRLTLSAHCKTKSCAWAEHP